MNPVEILKVILMGVIQGITEWLPVSSTGHMILFDSVFKLDVTDRFMEMFLVLVQLGSIFAVAALFWDKLFPFSFAKPRQGSVIKKDIINLWAKIIVASVPAALAGFTVDSYITDMFYNASVIAFTLILYGVLFIIIERANKAKKPRIASENDISCLTAFLIGIFQTLAIIPGTSRSGATIIGGMLLGLSRPAAASFSFFLAIPAMFGASAVKLLKFGFDLNAAEFFILFLGMAVAFVVSLLAVRFLMNFVKSKSFAVFGYYRIALGILIIALYCGI